MRFIRADRFFQRCSHKRELHLFLFRNLFDMKHQPTVADIWHALEEWAPASLAEEWDNVGLQVGHPEARVSRLVTALDITVPLIDFAVKHEAGMILTHHPLIFNPLKRLDFSLPLPAIIQRLIKNDIALASAHTNLDSAENGVSDELARLLNLRDVEPLLPTAPASDMPTGLGRKGKLPSPMRLGELAAGLAARLDLPGISASGDPDMIVNRVAVCGGSGSSLWPQFLDSGAELFISAEIKHSIYREAEMLGLAVIDAGHFSTEWPIIPKLTDYMKGAASRHGWELETVMFPGESVPAAWYAANR